MVNLDPFLAAVPEPLRPALAQRWQSYLDSAARSGITPVTDSAVLAQLIKVWSASEFVADACIRTPSLLDDLLRSGDLLQDNAYAGADYRRYAKRVAAALDINDLDEPRLMSRLRQLRQREAMRIAWRDLGGIADLSETLADLSDLAESILDITLETLYGWACERFGTPLGADKTPQRLGVA